MTFKGLCFSEILLFFNLIINLQDSFWAQHLWTQGFKKCAVDQPFIPCAENSLIDYDKPFYICLLIIIHFA